MHCFLVWFHFKTKIRECVPLLCDFNLFQNQNWGTPSSLAWFYFRTKIRECVAFSYDFNSFQNQNQGIHSFAVWFFFIYILYLLGFSMGERSFSRISMTAPGLLSGWRGVGSRKGFAQFPKDAQRLGLPPIPGILRWIFSARIFRSFFFSLSWLRARTRSPHCPGSAQPHAPALGPVPPRLPENPDCSRAPSQANANSRHTTPPCRSEQAKYWFNGAGSTGPARLPGPQPLNRSFLLRKAPFVACGKSAGCQEVLSGRWSWRRNGVFGTKGFLGQCLVLCGAFGAFLRHPDFVTCSEKMWISSPTSGYRDLGALSVVFNGFYV